MSVSGSPPRLSGTSRWQYEVVEPTERSSSPGARRRSCTTTIGVDFAGFPRTVGGDPGAGRPLRRRWQTVGRRTVDPAGRLVWRGECGYPAWARNPLTPGSHLHNFAGSVCGPWGWVGSLCVGSR